MEPALEDQSIPSLPRLSQKEGTQIRNNPISWSSLKKEEFKNPRIFLRKGEEFIKINKGIGNILKGRITLFAF